MQNVTSGVHDGNRETVPVEAPAPAPRRARRVPGWLREHLWLALLPICFLVYANSFSDRPIIDRQHSVLGDADAANFRLLLEDFSLTRVYGDPYNTVDRDVGDIAQKHKVHHVLYNMVGGTASRVLQALYAPFGGTRQQAIYSVNALIGCLNIVLLFFLLSGLKSPRQPVWPFLLLYAGALGTWVFSSVPESWPFSGTCVIAFLLLLQRARFQPLAFGVVLGAIMLNNLFLAAMFPLLVARSLREHAISWRWLRTMFVAGVLAVATWLAGLTLLSVFDPHFRPDHFVHYTLWFREFTSLDLPPTDPYVWQSAFSNLFITSIVSHQADPAVPQESLLYTLQSSLLGTAAIGAYLLLATWTFFRATRSLSAREAGERATARLGRMDAVLLLWAVLMLAVTGIAFYASGFLYSTVVLPVVIALIYRHLDLSVRWQQVLLFCTLALVLVTNAMQVLEFRSALLGM